LPRASCVYANLGVIATARNLGPARRWQGAISIVWFVMQALDD
jgi:hypothetical protein